MDLGLEGRIAIVTGGSQGIGRAIADVLVEEGAVVAICARRRHADGVVASNWRNHSWSSPSSLEESAFRRLASLSVRTATPSHSS